MGEPWASLGRAFGAASVGVHNLVSLGTSETGLQWHDPVSARTKPVNIPNLGPLIAPYFACTSFTSRSSMRGAELSPRTCHTLIFFGFKPGVEPGAST